jgi:hypothetical protein
VRKILLATLIAATAGLAGTFGATASPADGTSIAMAAAVKGTLAGDSLVTPAKMPVCEQKTRRRNGKSETYKSCPRVPGH